MTATVGHAVWTPEEALEVVDAFTREHHEWVAVRREVNEAKSHLECCEDLFKERSARLLDATHSLERLMGDLGLSSTSCAGPQPKCPDCRYSAAHDG
jgi:hypothetical protein